MQVNIDKLLKLKIPLEAYFILWCIYNEEVDALANYINNNKSIPINIYELLSNDNWLIFTGETNDLNNVELTDKFAKEFLGIINYNGTLTFDDAFQQLRDHFPIKAGNSERRLQGNPEKCKNLYKSIIIKNGRIDEALHSLILQCVNYEINLRTKAKSLEYFKLMTTWLNQREWELYKLEVEEIIRKDGFIDKNGSDELREDRL